ncbi:MAG: hypothetical protein NC918_00760 [Candidatus Omnitrophica bacterium]|nr:hypothetical protein [Candidatus Omnitrophota bacterium]
MQELGPQQQKNQEKQAQKGEHPTEKNLNNKTSQYLKQEYVSSSVSKQIIDFSKNPNPNFTDFTFDNKSNSFFYEANSKSYTYNSQNNQVQDNISINIDESYKNTTVDLSIPSYSIFNVHLAKKPWGIQRSIAEKFGSEADLKKIENEVDQSLKSFPFFDFFFNSFLESCRFLPLFSSIQEMEDFKNELQKEFNQQLEKQLPLSLNSAKEIFSKILKSKLDNILARQDENQKENQKEKILSNFNQITSGYTLFINASGECFYTKEIIPNVDESTNDKDFSNALRIAKNYNSQSYNENNKLLNNLSNQYKGKFSDSIKTDILLNIEFSELSNKQKREELIEQINQNINFLNYLVENYNTILSQESNNFFYNQLKALLKEVKYEELKNYVQQLTEELMDISNYLNSDNEKQQQIGFIKLQSFLQKVSSARKITKDPNLNNKLKNSFFENDDSKINKYNFFNDLLNFTSRGFILIPNKEREDIYTLKITLEEKTSTQKQAGPVINHEGYAKFKVELDSKDLNFDPEFYKETIRQIFLDVNPNHSIELFTLANEPKNLYVVVKFNKEVNITEDFIGKAGEINIPKTFDLFNQNRGFSVLFVGYHTDYSSNISGTNIKNKEGSGLYLEMNPNYGFSPAANLTAVGPNVPKEILYRPLSAELIIISNNLFFEQKLEYPQAFVITFLDNSAFFTNLADHCDSFEDFEKKAYAYLGMHIDNNINLYLNNILIPSDIKNKIKPLQNYSFSTEKKLEDYINTLPKFYKEQFNLLLKFSYKLSVFEKKKQAYLANQSQEAKYEMYTAFNELKDVYEERLNSYLSAIDNDSFARMHVYLIYKELLNFAKNNGLTVTFTKNENSLNISVFTNPKGINGISFPNYPTSGLISTGLGNINISGVSSIQLSYNYQESFNIFGIPITFSATPTISFYHAPQPTSHKNNNLLELAKAIKNNYDKLFSFLLSNQNLKINEKNSDGVSAEYLIETLRASVLSLKGYAEKLGAGYEGIVQYCDRILDWLDFVWLKKNFNVNKNTFGEMENSEYFGLISVSLSSLISMLTNPYEGIIPTFFGDAPYSNSTIRTNFSYNFGGTYYGGALTNPFKNILPLFALPFSFTTSYKSNFEGINFGGSLDINSDLAFIIAKIFFTQKYVFKSSKYASIGKDQNDNNLTLTYETKPLNHYVPLPIISNINLFLSKDFKLSNNTTFEGSLDVGTSLFGIQPSSFFLNPSFKANFFGPIGLFTVDLQYGLNYQKLFAQGHWYDQNSLRLLVGFEPIGGRFKSNISGFYNFSNTLNIKEYGIQANIQVVLNSPKKTVEVKDLSEKDLSYLKSNYNFLNKLEQQDLSQLANYLENKKVVVDGKTLYEIGKKLYTQEEAMFYISQSLMLYNHLLQNNLDLLKFVGLEPVDSSLASSNPYEPKFKKIGEDGIITYISIDQTLDLIKYKLSEISPNKQIEKSDSSLLGKWLAIFNAYSVEINLINNVIK